MTDRERNLINTYLPSPPDAELGFMDFYMRDSADRVIRVHAAEIAVGEEGEFRRVWRKNGSGVFNASGEVSRMPGWYYVWALYDNKQDCRDNSHCLYNGWEHLRRLQQEATPEPPEEEMP